MTLDIFGLFLIDAHQALNLGAGIIQAVDPAQCRFVAIGDACERSQSIRFGAKRHA